MTGANAVRGVSCEIEADTAAAISTCRGPSSVSGSPPLRGGGSCPRAQCSCCRARRYPSHLRAGWAGMGPPGSRTTGTPRTRSVLGTRRKVLPSFLTVTISSIRTFLCNQIHVHSVKSKSRQAPLSSRRNLPPTEAGTTGGDSATGKDRMGPRQPHVSHRRHRNRPHGPSTPSPPRDFPHFSRLSPGCHRVGSVSLAPQYRPPSCGPTPRASRLPCDAVPRSLWGARCPGGGSRGRHGGAAVSFFFVLAWGGSSFRGCREVIHDPDPFPRILAAHRILRVSFFVQCEAW